MKSLFVYIMASKNNRVLYIGVTNNLRRRLTEHKERMNEGFTKRYNCHNLVYFEEHSPPMKTIQREKQLKKWNRDWKVELIEEKNPEWNDLSTDWFN